MNFEHEFSRKAECVAVAEALTAAGWEVHWQRGINNPEHYFLVAYER